MNSRNMNVAQIIQWLELQFSSQLPTSLLLSILFTYLEKTSTINVGFGLKFNYPATTEN